MAKKVRRVRRKKRNNRPTGKNQAEDVPQAEAVDPNTVNTESSRKKQKDKVKLTPEEELREEYAYVVYDLRRIAILAAALFILLILLNLLI